MARPSPAPTTAPAAHGFGPLLAVRGLSLVTDHALKWLAIGLGKRLVDAGEVSLVLTIGLIGLSLPYVLFSWLAGALADRHSKTTVIRWCKAAEVLIALAAAAVLGLGMGSGASWLGLPTGLWLLLATVIAIGTQAAVMTPSVVGAIPEVVPPARLAAANGLFALVSLVCVLAGTAAGNWVADATPLEPSAAPWTRAWPTAALLGGAAVAGLAAAGFMPRLRAADPDAPPAWNALARTWTDLGLLLRRPELAAAAAGIVFFWAIAAVAQANVDQFATEAGAESQGRIVPLLVALVAGIGAGSVITGRLASRPANADPQVDLGFVPLGGAIMAVAFVALAMSGGPFLAGDAAIPWGPIAWLVVLGLGAGMFDVPLETYLQEKSPADRLGGVLAATNLLLFSGMFLASLAYGGLRAPVGPDDAPLLSARAIFGLFALLSCVAAGAAVWCAPRATLRLFVASIVHATWRFRARGLERIPPTGPVVIVANHLSWLDGFLLPMASPRPVRMVVYGPNIKGKFLRMLSDQWRFILFDPRPKSIGTALKAIQGGLAEGDAIGIFCEGGISRTGQIMGFKRGLEWLLERVESPILPASIDGMWGSLLSYSEGRYFTKWPRGFRRTVTLTFGSPLPVGTSTDLARLALQELTADVVRRRMRPRRPPPGFAGDWAAACAEAEAFEGACLLRRGDRIVTSLASDDPLAATLGAHATTLLGIPATSLAATVATGDIARALVTTRATVWLARVSQVEALAAEPDAPRLSAHLAAIVMPITAAADLPATRRAAERFREAHGIEPVVAYCPREAGCLVAMNTPPARSAGDFEVTHKPDTLGRVLNGGVVWPQASLRPPLGLPPVETAEIAADADATLVISALIPCPAASNPGATLLADQLDVDKEGFLVPRGASTSTTAGD